MIEPPADLRIPKAPPDPHRRLAEIARQQSELATEAAALIAALAGEPDRDVATKIIGKPELVALKRVAGKFGMSDRRMKRWAEKHGALRKLSGRLMVDVAALERHF